MALPVLLTKDGVKKSNKWVCHLLPPSSLQYLTTPPQFSIETDDTTAYRDELNLWRTCGGFQARPPPLILETYLDTSSLTRNQSLVIVDDNGKRWDVLESLNNSGSSDEGANVRKRNTEVILERWKFELKGTPGEPYDFNSALPTIYKKCIVFFRSLYSIAKFVPTWKFVKGLSKSGSGNMLRVNCRIIAGDVQSGRFDALTHPLYESSSPTTTDYFLGSTETPAGHFSADVTYRNDCAFRIDDSESLLSSRFMGADEHFFQPSLRARRSTHGRDARHIEAGSLPANRQRTPETEPIQAYGSLSTFHGDAPPRGSSPISAIRAVKPIGSETSSPTNSLPQERPGHVSRASLRSLEGINMARRPSVSFQPFKAGSISSSPGRAGSFPNKDMPPPQSSQSLPRIGTDALAHARNRSSLTAGMPASLRGGPAAPENTVASSGSNSPKPAPISRYSSSFTHRRQRPSFGGSSKIADDDQNSSGKQSLSSSAQRGSGTLAEGGPGGSSGSLQTDDDNISDFLKLLDSKKTLQSFQPSGEASTKRTTAQLSRFQSMRESNNALTDSISSSTMLHRSSSSSSRQLSSVPPMVVATSMSASSSPGKPISPHTPHTPAIPSRLSANSIAEYSAPHRRLHATPETQAEDPVDEQVTGRGTNAIDIPTSPRPYYMQGRRSSSVAQQHRSLAVDDDLGELPFGANRSISLGAGDRETVNLSTLLGDQTPGNTALLSSQKPPRSLQPAPRMSESTGMSRQPSSSLETHETRPSPSSRAISAISSNPLYRPNLGRSGGRGTTPPRGGSYSSLVEKASGSGLSDNAGGKYSFSKPAGAYETDDELVFDMSEIGRDLSRRSLEEGRGGGAGASTSDRGAFDGGRGAGSSASSRRHSTRPGWE